MRTIPTEESITVEFKSDRKRLPDKDLVETVVCLTNTDGGTIYLGVEDDGNVTGLHTEHQDVAGIAALISNRTTPPVSVRVNTQEEEGIRIAIIEVPKSQRITATTDGMLKRRRLQLDGKPECVPFVPHEFASRQADMGLMDNTNLPVQGATLDDLDNVERQHLKRMVQQYSGDTSILQLDDESLDGALGFVRTENGVRVPTVLGLLMIGHESALRKYIPTHEVAFQVLEGEEVIRNEFTRAPLLQVIERINTLFDGMVREREFQVGLFRVSVPTIERRAFREAVANALTHRDYTRMGAVHIRWDQEALTISNPGGFVEGVTLRNLLTVEPKPRNPILADALKRVGLVERTGRGVDLIYRGMLRYGRPFPDYGRSDSSSVVVSMSTAKADMEFLRLVVSEENAIQAPLPVDTLIVLALLWTLRRVDIGSVSTTIQKDENAARKTLERLVERGMVEAHGVKKGRTYTLSASVYRDFGRREEYIRQAGYESAQQEEMVRSWIKSNKSLKRENVISLCKLSAGQASRLLARLTEKGILERHGKNKGSYYTRGPNI